MGKISRQEQITVTLSTKEREWVEHYAEMNGLPLSTAMRYLALSQLNFLSRVQYWNRKPKGTAKDVAEEEPKQEMERDDWAKYYYRGRNQTESEDG